MSVNGYSVIPLGAKKIPAIKEWKQYQNTPATDEEIEQWWTKNPKANIGIVTGKISGITVVDIDVKGDEVVPLETFPETFTVKTPSGGYHLYYEYDKSIKQTANTYPQFPHVDIRNDGGYVVGPGSMGGKYEVVNQMPVQPFPKKLFGKGKKKEKKAVVDRIKDVVVMTDGEGRNAAMTSLLGSMLKGQTLDSYPTIKTAFFEISKAMQDPLPERELEIIWNSIAKVAAPDAEPIQLIVNSQGVPYKNIENIRKILLEDQDFQRRVVFDTFLQKHLYRPRGGQYRELNDSDEITITREISVKYGSFATIQPTMVRMALMEVARDNCVDAARDWLESIKWDGEARLDTWLTKTFNVEDNVYHRAVGSNWLKGMAKRIVDPGCKFDYVLVLEGKQGTRKSTSMGILGGDWYIETTASPDNKDFFMMLQGNLVIEFSEGESLSRADIKQLKAVITTQYDKFRAPYERHIQTHPRRCVFAMTTNQEEYLKDETGNRRWLPVATVGDANTDWLKDNRDQLLAEALHRVRDLKETTYEFPEEVYEEQAKRQVTDPNRDRVIEWYENYDEGKKRQGVTPHQVHVEALGMFSGSKFTKMDAISITNILRSIGLEQRRVRVGKDRIYRWFEPDAQAPSVYMTAKEIELEF